MNHLSNNNQHRWTRSELVWSVISVVKRQTLSRGRKKMMIERWGLPTVIIGIMRSHFGVTVRDEEVSLDLRSRNGIRVAIRWQKWHHPTPEGRINSARFYMQSSWLYHPIRIARSVLTGTDEWLPNIDERDRKTDTRGTSRSVCQENLELGLSTDVQRKTPLIAKRRGWESNTGRRSRNLGQRRPEHHC